MAVFDMEQLNNLFKNATYSSKGKNKNRKTYWDISIMYDIETSSFMYKGDKCAITYSHCVGIMDITSKEQYIYHYRTNEDIIKFFDLLTAKAGQYGDHRLVIYIHNAGYDLAFTGSYINFDEIFANGDIRKILYARTPCIEFRCSYMLTQKSLKEIGKTTESKKLEYDYDLIRTPETPLTKDEMDYIIADVKVGIEYISKCINDEKGVANIPLTKTGYVRRRFRNKVGNDTAYMNLLNGLTLSLDEYDGWRKAFAGGFTHANAYYTGETVPDVASFDLTSAYPSVFFRSYPMSKGQAVYPTTQEEALSFMEKFHCLMWLKLTDVETHYPFPMISTSHIVAKDGSIIEDNGRLQLLDGTIYLICNEEDFKHIMKVYDVGEWSVSKMYLYKKGLLPKQFLDVVLDMYKDKTKLKGLKGVNPETGRDVELDYLSAKGDFNATYGMTVQDPLKEEFVIEFDDELQVNRLAKATYDNPDDEIAVMQDRLRKYNQSKQRFLFYPWGCYVTTYVRGILLDAMIECTQMCTDPTKDMYGYITKDDWVYSDTDSVKIRNPQEHKPFFDRFNENLSKVYEPVMKAYGYTPDQFAPTDKKGKARLLGEWDYEGDYINFKTLGAKRYMIEHYIEKKGANELEITVSGIKKHGKLKEEETKALGYNVYEYGPSEYITDHGGFDFFCDEMEIPKEISGRTVHTFIDHPIEGDIIDYKGNKYHFYQKTGIHLSTAPYSLTIAQQYKDMLTLAREWR